MPRKHLIFTLLALMAIICVNTLWWHNPIIGTIGMIIYVASLLRLGSFGVTNQLLKQPPILLLIFICGIMFFGAGIYYIYALPQWLILLISTLLMGVLAWRAPTTIPFTYPLTNPTINPKSRSFWLAFVYGILFVGFITTIVLFQTNTSVASPWLVLPWWYFLIYAGLTAAAVGFLATSNSTRAKLIMAATFILTSISTAHIFYSSGFGFDPFIHQATEKVIAEQGVIYPKPLYYLGQYALVTFIHTLSQLPINLIDRRLVPFLAALLIPLFSFLAFREEKKTATLWILLLIVPYSYFITSTPLSLALTIAFVTILGAFSYRRGELPGWFLWLTTGAAIATHAIVGLPLLAFTVFITAKTLPTTIKRVVFVTTAVLTPMLVPGALLLNSWLHGQPLNWSWQPIIEAAAPAIHTLHHPVRDLLYQYLDALPVLFMLTAIGGLYLAWKQTEKRFLFWNGYLAVATLISAYVLKYHMSFTDVIQYERGYFAERLIYLSALFALPLVLLAIARLIIRIQTVPQIIYRIAGVALLVGILTASHYASYPRFDNYELEKSYNVTAADFALARELDKSTVPYVVLAPQTTSAAALTLFGFDKQLNGMYIYPIPTGGPLYQYYLRMINEYPSRSTADEVRALTGAKTVYFVIPSFWRNSPQRIDQAKKEADSFQMFGQDLTVFTYTF